MITYLYRTIKYEKRNGPCGPGGIPIEVEETSPISWGSDFFVCFGKSGKHWKVAWWQPSSFCSLFKNAEHDYETLFERLDFQYNSIHRFAGLQYLPFSGNHRRIPGTLPASYTVC